MVFRLVLLLNVGDKDKGKMNLSPQNIPWGIATRDAHSMQDFVRYELQRPERVNAGKTRAGKNFSTFSDAKNVTLLAETEGKEAKKNQTEDKKGPA